MHHQRFKLRAVPLLKLVQLLCSNPLMELLLVLHGCRGQLLLWAHLLCHS